MSGETVRVRVSPQGVEEISPAGAVVSMVIAPPDKVDARSVEAIWSTFCHSIYFFPSRKEAEQWAAGRDDIEIISVTEGYELAKLLSGRLLAYE